MRSNWARREKRNAAREGNAGASSFSSTAKGEVLLSISNFKSPGPIFPLFPASLPPASLSPRLPAPAPHSAP
jgi:hypothetical protein